METLYQKIKNLETTLDAVPLERHGKPATLYEAAQVLLQDQNYEGNSVVRRLRQGERLEEITKGIIKQRKYKLKFNRPERENYNAQVKYLAQVVDDAEGLRMNSFFGFMEGPEGPALYGGSLFTLVAGYGLIAVPPALDFSQAIIPALGVGVFGGALSAFFSSTERLGATRHPKMWSQIRYLDQILQKEVPV